MEHQYESLAYAMELSKEYFEKHRHRKKVKDLIGMQKHAQTCTTQGCPVPRCDKTKIHQKHVSTCEAPNCKVRDCWLSKQAEYHTQNCTNVSCVICRSSDKILLAAKKSLKTTNSSGHSVPIANPLPQPVNVRPNSAAQSPAATDKRKHVVTAQPQSNHGPEKIKQSTNHQINEQHYAAKDVPGPQRLIIPGSLSVQRPLCNSGRARDDSSDTIEQLDESKSVFRNESRSVHFQEHSNEYKTSEHQSKSGSKTDSSRTVQQLEVQRSATGNQPRLQDNTFSRDLLKTQPNFGSRIYSTGTVIQEVNTTNIKHPHTIRLTNESSRVAAQLQSNSDISITIPQEINMCALNENNNTHILNPASRSAAGSRLEQSHHDVTNMATQHENKTNADQPSTACTVNRKTYSNENATTVKDDKPDTNNTGPKSSTKRIHDMSSKPSGSNSKARRVEVETNLQVAIANATSTNLTSVQTRQIKTYLEQHIIEMIKNKVPQSQIPVFSAKFKTEYGVLKLWCKNKDTLTWLNNTVMNMEPLWPDMRLTVKRQLDLMIKSKICLNDCEYGLNEIREIIVGQNQWARADLWKFDDNTKKKGTEIIVEMEVPPTLVEVIQKHNRCLSVGIDVAYIEFLGISATDSDCCQSRQTIKRT